MRRRLAMRSSPSRQWKGGKPRLVRYSPTSNRQMSTLSRISVATSASIMVVESAPSLTSRRNLAPLAASLSSTLSICCRTGAKSQAACAGVRSVPETVVTSSSRSVTDRTLPKSGDFIPGHIIRYPPGGGGRNGRKRGDRPWAISRFRRYLSNRPKVHSDAPAGTLARLGSPARSAYTPPMPAMTVMYCLPSFSQVTGCPTMPDEVWKLQRSLPVSASWASNSPVITPVNTRLLAVDMVDEKFGLLYGTAHLSLPVIGSTAFRKPRTFGSSTTVVRLTVPGPDGLPGASCGGSGAS